MIVVRNVSQRVTLGGEALTILQGIDLEVKPAETVALVGASGSGKSTLLAALKAELHGKAYYWPTQDRLAFAFNTGMAETENGGTDDDAEALSAQEDAEQKRGYSSGERQLQVLREIVEQTSAPVYLLDEWDANLDAGNRTAARALVEELARRARVIEVSHRDRG